MSVYRTSSEVATRNIGGETMLIPITGKLADLRRIHVLNAVGVHIWERLDGQQDIAAIAETIPGDFDVSPERAREDCSTYMAELTEAGLVEECA